MSKNGHSNDATAETLTLVINALLAHEKEIDRLINCIGELTEDQSVNSEKLSSRIQRIEKKTSRLKGQIAKFQKCVAPDELNGEWRAFQESAAKADSLTFMYSEKEKTIQLEANKNGHPMSYSGKAPTMETLLKTWLAQKLKIPNAENVTTSGNQNQDRETFDDSDHFVAFTCDANPKEAT